MISTRGRYALRVMLDLAKNAKGDSYVPMREVSARQGLSLKYMERIMPFLTKQNFVEGQHGKGGGYRLCRAPKDYTVGEILRATESDLAPVSCLESGAVPCRRAGICPTLPMWKEYYDMTNRYFDGITLQKILDETEVASAGKKQ